MAIVEGNRAQTTSAQTGYSYRAMKTAIVLSVGILLCVLVLTGVANLQASAQTKPVPNAQLASKELNVRV
jgi:hypothetical protein